MTRTTPARPVSAEAEFPELAPYRARTTRLHPRPGRPGMHDSHVGGPMLWPDGEPWPICHEPHQRESESEGYAPEEIRSARAAGVWPRSQPWPHAETPGRDGPVPFVGLAQFFHRDIPGLACGPDGADLVQFFRCPLTHGPYLERRYRLRWRQAVQTEHAERFLADPPHVPLLRWEHELPEPCVLHPEEVDTYPWAEGDTLPASLISRIDAWDDAQVAEHGPEAPSYQSDLSIPPGWRVGGFPSWASTGPKAIDCVSCATPIRLLLTAGGGEMDATSHSWVPLEDRDPTLRGKASIRGGQAVAHPLGSASAGTMTCTFSPARPIPDTRPNGCSPRAFRGEGPGMPPSEISMLCPADAGTVTSCVLTAPSGTSGMLRPRRTPPPGRGHPDDPRTRHQHDTDDAGLYR